MVGISERKEVIKIGFEDVEIWPDWCFRESKDCRQCHLQGKIACHPRFRQGLKPPTDNIDELLKQGKTPNEVQKVTRAKIGTIYSRGQKLRRKGEIVRLRPPYPEEKKQEILRSVREHPEKEYKEIATMLNVEASYISRLCNKVGIHRRKMLDEKKEEQTKKAIEILKHNPQRSVASIADEFRLAPPTLITRLRKRGVLPIDHATRIVLDAIREEVIEAVKEAISTKKGELCCPKCGNELNDYCDNHGGYRYDYRQYSCHKCRLTWDWSRSKKSGLIKLEECRLYPIDQYKR